MTIPTLFSLRRIIPRWRISNIALRTGELFSPLSISSKGNLDYGSFKDKLDIWTKNKEVEYAAEVVSAAISQGIYSEAVDPAKFLIQNQKYTTQSVLGIAKEVLIRAGCISRKDPYNANGVTGPKAIYTEIHYIRQKLSEYPRNALLWSDLALYYTKIGQLKQSYDAMNVAILLAPNNRFVLRSAARLYIHAHDPEKAHDLLVTKDVTRNDPWLLAAEIAIACVANRTSKLVRLGKYQIESNNFSHFQTAELASAIGTLELHSGGTKRARKLFQQSLINPTENSVAQSIWVKNELPFLDTNGVLYNTPGTFEARAVQALRNQDWELAVAESEKWMNDEFYSSRPAELGSYAALVGMDNYPLAEKILRIAIIANPDDLILINNLAFSVANQKEREYEAYTLLKSAINRISDARYNVPIKATMGLINLRLGKLDEGQQLYLEAISIAQKKSNFEQAAIASIYYAKEMMLAGLFTKEEAIAFAENAAKTRDHPHTNLLMEKYFSFSDN